MRSLLTVNYIITSLVLRLEKIERKRDDLIEQIIELGIQKRETDDPLVQEELTKKQEKLKVEIEALNVTPKSHTLG